MPLLSRSVEPSENFRNEASTVNGSLPVRALISVSMIVVSALSFAACSNSDDGRIHTRAEGMLTISDQPDSTQDFGGFEVLLATQEDGDIDTLALAVTDVDGHFVLDISARKEGVYPLIVRRANVKLSTDQYVVAEGDTAKITGRYPLGGRRLRIVSRQNTAWIAYLNAKSQYNTSMLRMLNAGDTARQSVPQIAEQTASVLWSLRSSYPSTFGSDLASAESIEMLEGWNDPLAVDRLQELRPDNLNIVDAVKAARRSEARIAGQASSISLIEHYREQMTDPEMRAELTSELVVAYTDSLQSEEALKTALELRREYPDSKWAAWAASAAYELENLLPGMIAPSFSVKTRDGATFTLENARNFYFVLEFYAPRNDAFQRELKERDTVFSAMNPLIFRTLSVSLEPDQDINEALFEEADHAGAFAYAGDPESTIGTAYNIHLLPTRFLIDPDGLIVSKYFGFALRPLEEDLVEIARGYQEPAASDD